MFFFNRWKNSTKNFTFRKMRICWFRLKSIMIKLSKLITKNANISSKQIDDNKVNCWMILRCDKIVILVFDVWMMFLKLMNNRYCIVNSEFWRLTIFKFFYRNFNFTRRFVFSWHSVSNLDCESMIEI